MTRTRRFLPVVAVASAVLATLALAAAHWAALDAFWKDSQRLTAGFASFQGLPVPSLEEVRAAERLAKVLGDVAWWLEALFVVTTGAALFVARDRIRDWPWLSALSLALALLVLYFGIVVSAGLWALLPILGAAAGALAVFELARARRAARRPSVVSWAALGVAGCSLIVSVFRVRG